MGYHRAGFAVYGIDNKPQPHYPFPFLLMDAMEAMNRLLRGEGLTFSNGETLYLRDFDAYHASPPCQFATQATVPWKAKGRVYENLIPQARQYLRQSGKPYVIENVVGARKHLCHPILLCGAMFKLRTYRHRLFEMSIDMPLILHPGHGVRQGQLRGAADAREAYMLQVVGHPSFAGESALWKIAMGIDWMTTDELSQAIPPAYTEFIGRYLMQSVMRLE